MMYVILLVLYYLTVCSGKIRHYYLAAVEIEWDYAPLGSNMITKETNISDDFIKNSNNRIGSIYTKIVFRQFTDDLFNTSIPTPEWMGILGPLIRAEVGDEMHVHFKNLAYSSGRPFSVHPHGVLYSKNSEGAIYLDNTSGADKLDDGCMPGHNYTYIWKVPPEFGPTPADPSCIPWGYHSHVNSDKDIDTGLMGMLLTCKAGALNVDGTRKDYSKEYIVYMDIADENNAWTIQSNLMKCGDPAQCLHSPDVGFVPSNVMWHVNGYVYGNLPAFEVNVDERTMWYIMSLNNGIHSISFSGNTLIHRNHRVDTIPFLPSTFLSAEMIPANEGNWLLYSRVSENFQGGMAAFYKVNPRITPKRKRQADVNRNQENLLNGFQTTGILPYLNPWYPNLYTGTKGFKYNRGPLFNRFPAIWTGTMFWNSDQFRMPPPHVNPLISRMGSRTKSDPKYSDKNTPTTDTTNTEQQPKAVKGKAPSKDDQFTSMITKLTSSLDSLTTTDSNFLDNIWKRSIQSPVFDNTISPWFGYQVGSMFPWMTSSRRFSRNAPARPGPTRRNIKRYYLAIEKDNWNYAPSGQDKFNGGRLLDNPKSKPFFERGPIRIGGQYIKARYVEYTDGTFTKRVERSKEEEHLGLLGPPIIAEVGDDLIVVLRNNADRTFSFLPHGVVYQKNDEGFNYKDMESGQLTGKLVNPGGTETYTFSIPNVNAGPTVSDSPCVTHTYQSAVDPVRDLNTGLFGPIVICKKGQLKNSFNQVNTRSWFFNHKHIYLALLTIDENLSWYIDENIRASAWSSELVDKQDPMFRESNAMHSINGLLYGNLDSIDMCLNENIVWHLMDFGGTTDMHGLYIHGQTWVEFGNNIDSKGLLPGYSSTMWSKPDTVGTWALECRTNSHYESGMVTKYTVNQCNRTEAVMGNTKVRRYHIGAVEVDWDYAPSKRSVTDGQAINDTNQKGGVFVVDTEFLIGSIYKKAVYRLFTDATFKEQVPRSAAEDHLEIMGPYIKAEVGERIEVVFKNMAGKPLSIHPQGLQYSKSMEGANYFDKSGNVEPSNSVDPGQTFTYKWTVPVRSGPGVNDPNCIGRMYYSSVDSIVDIYTGLFGPLVICRNGILTANGHRMDVDKEFAVMFMVIDENKSFYIKENIKKYAPMHNQMISKNIPEPNNLNAPIRGIQPMKNSAMNFSSEPGMPYQMNNHNMVDVHHTHASMTHGQMDPGSDMGNQNVMVGPLDGKLASVPNPDIQISINDTVNILERNGKLPHQGTNKNTIQKGSTPVEGENKRMSKIHPIVNNPDGSITAVFPNRRRKKRKTLNKNVGKVLHANFKEINKTSLKTILKNRFRRQLNSSHHMTNRMNTNSSMMQQRNIHMKHGGNGEMMFEHSNHMNSINGRLMGNLNGIVMDQNDKVVWYIMGLGSAEDYHPVHIHGQVFTRRSDRAHRSDVIEVFPSTSDTVEMLAVNPGQWILHCHFSKHNKNGMQLIYTVNPKP